jgi:hypothetical protein
MKKAAKQSPRKAEQTDYRAWKIEAAADLTNRHPVAPGTIPQRPVGHPNKSATASDCAAAERCFMRTWRAVEIGRQLRQRVDCG